MASGVMSAAGIGMQRGRRPRPGPGQRVRAGPGSPGWPTATAASPDPYPARRRRSCSATVLLGMRSCGLPPGRRLRGRPRRLIERPHRRHCGRAAARLAEDLAAGRATSWNGKRSRHAEEEEQPDSDVIMMQGAMKRIAMRPEHSQERLQGGWQTRPGIKKMAEIVARRRHQPRCC